MISADVPINERRLTSLGIAISAAMIASLCCATQPSRATSPAPPSTSPAPSSTLTASPLPSASSPPADQPTNPNRLAIWPPGATSPTFDLRDTDGTPRTLHDYHGQIVVVFFGFTHCPDACPAGLFKLAQVMKELGPRATQVQVLFITLDPDRDTPASLKHYASAFNPTFTGLTGTPAQVDQAASNFNVQYARVPLGNDYTIDHSTGIYVFDGSGRLRLVGPVNAPVADFAHDIGALAAEQSNRR